jgi:hypothetical protein
MALPSFMRGDLKRHGQKLLVVAADMTAQQSEEMLRCGHARLDGLVRPSPVNIETRTRNPPSSENLSRLRGYMPNARAHSLLTISLSKNPLRINRFRDRS